MKTRMEGWKNGRLGGGIPSFYSSILPTKAIHFFFFSICFVSQALLSQVSAIDSLKLALKNAKHDTTRCNILSAMIDAEPNDKIWTVYNDQLKRLAEKNSAVASDSVLKFFYLDHLSNAYNNIGFLAQEKGRQADFLEYFNKSLKIQEEIGNIKKIALYLNNIGYTYKNQGNIAKALEYYSQSLKKSQEIGDKKGIALSFNNIGLIYSTQGDAAKALEYYSKNLKIQTEIGDKYGMAGTLNNIGLVYSKQGDFVRAYEFYSKCLKLVEETGDKKGIGHALHNLGLTYGSQGNFAKALEYYYKSLKVREEIADKKGSANTMNNLGAIYLKQKNYDKALEYCTRSLVMSKAIGYPENIRNAAEKLKTIYQKFNKPKQALEMYELFIQMRDSISNQETKKASIKTQLKYEYEKKSAADSVKNAEQQKVKDAQLAAQTASLKQEKFQRYSLVVGLSLVVCGLLFVVNRFRVTQKQKKIIEVQKIKVDEAFEKLHEKNKEVMDSIRYAKRIQTALLTSEKYIERKLNNLNS